METNYILEMKNLYKSFGGLHALTDISFNLRHGEVLGLVGDNAAGIFLLGGREDGLLRRDGISADQTRIARNVPPVEGMALLLQCGNKFLVEIFTLRIRS